MGSLLRTINAVVLLAAGPDIEFNYYLNPTFQQWLARFTFGFFYPLVFAGFTLQVLLWIDMLVKIKRMQLTSPRWVWISFFVWLIVLSIFEITIELLLIFNVDAVAVVRAYRIILSAFLLALLIMVAIFGVRFFYVMRDVAPAASAGSEARRRSRSNLTRLVLLSAALLFCAFVATLTIAIVPIRNAQGYFAMQYTIRFFDAAGERRSSLRVVCADAFWFSGIPDAVHLPGNDAQQAAAAGGRQAREQP